VRSRSPPPDQGAADENPDQGDTSWQSSPLTSCSTPSRSSRSSSSASSSEEEEVKDSFDVILEAAGDKKIQVIKVVRELTSLGLGEAKAVVDGAPKAVLEGANKETADKAKAALEEAGASVTLK
jgi:large subunit ribosomal protein L7/L12